LNNLLSQTYDKLLKSHSRLDSLFLTQQETNIDDDSIAPKCLKSLANALDTLSNQSILACKLLREENRLLRKERKLIMLENSKLKEQCACLNTSADHNEQDWLLKEMND